MRDQLNDIMEKEANTIKAFVAQQALEYHDPKNFFIDLLQHGCISGMVSELVYYRDTHAFFERHYYEIEEIRQSLEECIGQSLEVDGDLKNWYVWMAVEETAREIAGELNMNM